MINTYYAFPLQPEEYDRTAPSDTDYCTSPLMPAYPALLPDGFSIFYCVLPPLYKVRRYQKFCLPMPLCICQRDVLRAVIRMRGCCQTNGGTAGPAPVHPARMSSPLIPTLTLICGSSLIANGVAHVFDTQYAFKQQTLPQSRGCAPGRDKAFPTN